jgi:subtilisin family serine protease
MKIRKNMQSFIFFMGFLTVILNQVPAFGFSCKENNLSFDSASLLLEIKNNKSYFNDSKYLKSYLQKKLGDINFNIEPLFENSSDQSLAKNLGLEKIYKLSLETQENQTKDECQTIKTVMKILKNDKNFSEISLDYEMETQTNDFFYNTQGAYWSLNPLDELFAIKNYGIDEIWQTRTGSGVIVAVIDTGVDYNHPDLWNNIWVNPQKVLDRNQDGKINLDDVDLNSNHFIDANEITANSIGRNFVNNSFDPLDKEDGHGTHVAGVIASQKENSIGIAGVAPDAKILPIKALNDQGKGKFSNIAKAIIYASDHNANIINASWGCNCIIPEILKKAYRYSARKGVINITAAGNNGSKTNNYAPGNLAQTLSVGSLDSEGNLSSFSNYGTSVDIAGPGQNILSTLAHGTLINQNPATRMQKDPDYDYYYISGTSASAAFISGVSALLLSKYPKLSQKELKKLLQESSDPISGYSFGRVNPTKLFD